LYSDEDKSRSKRTKEQAQAKNRTGTTPSNQTRRQAGGFCCQQLQPPTSHDLKIPNYPKKDQCGGDPTLDPLVSLQDKVLDAVLKARAPA